MARPFHLHCHDLFDDFPNLRPTNQPSWYGTRLGGMPCAEACRAGESTRPSHSEGQTPGTRPARRWPPALAQRRHPHGQYARITLRQRVPLHQSQATKTTCQPKPRHRPTADRPAVPSDAACTAKTRVKPPLYRMSKSAASCPRGSPLDETFEKPANANRLAWSHLPSPVSKKRMAITEPMRGRSAGQNTALSGSRRAVTWNFEVV